MEFSVHKIKKNVQQLVSMIQKPSEKLNFLLDFLGKKSYRSSDIECLLRCLSSSLLDETLTIPIATAFEDCLLLLITNALCGNDFENGIEYQWKCIALAKLMHLSLCAKRFALSYFLDKPAPFSTSCDEVASKKSKTNLSNKPDALAIVKCCFYLLKADTSFFKDLWNWSEFLLCYGDPSENESPLLKVYRNHIVAMLTNMNASTLHKLNEKIPEELLIEFHEEQESMRLLNLSDSVGDEFSESSKDTICISPNSALFVTNIEGVFLPIFNRDNYDYFHMVECNQESIVRVESTRVNLRSIALGITSGKAICLSGPVGCGKTTLVEYLARMTGRIAPKKDVVEDELNSVFNQENNQIISNVNSNNKQGNCNKRKIVSTDVTNSAPTNGFLRIQLGDQTDSKMLLGQYHCTDVPGEFIWLPGVLTQAVMNGYWLLLEDLDCATTDTFTVLSSLLENNYLSVPGFRDCVKVTPGFQLFVTVRTHKSSSSNWSQKALFSLLEKHLYPINILPLSRNELCEVIRRKYSKLATVANRMVDVFLTFSSGDHNVADNLRQQETRDKASATESFQQLPYEEVNMTSLTSSGRLVSTRDLIKLCQRSNPSFSVTSTECAYFVFQNAVDIFCSYLPNSKEKTKLIVGIGAKLGIIQSRCEYLADEFKPDVCVDSERIKVGRAELYARSLSSASDERNEMAMKELSPEEQSLKRLKLSNGEGKVIRHFSTKSHASSTTFSFTRLASCLLERIAVCVANAEPVLLVGETGVGKTSSVQYLAARTKHKLVVVNMNNQSDVSDLVGGFKPVDLAYVIAPLRTEFEVLFRRTFNQSKNESFLTKFSICYNQGNFSVIVKLMIKVVDNIFEKSERNELREKDLLLMPRWMALKIKLQKLNSQLSKSINISFAFIPGSLVNCIKNGDWLLLDEINLASAETLECLSTILEPDGSVVLLEKGDFTPVKRHPDFRIFSCMNPNTDIGKKDLPVGIRNRFTEFFVDEAETEADLSLLISDYLSATGIQKKSVMSIVKLYKRLKSLAKLELNDGLGNRPVYSLRTLCRSLTICAKNLCGSIERNLYESFCLSFLTQLDPQSHNVVQHLIKEALLSNAKAVLQQAIPKPGENYLNFEGYWIEKGPKELQDCSNYILTDSVKENLKDLARIISIGKLPILLQGPTSAGKTSLIDYVARRSGNHCLRINNHEHTDLQEYIGTYTTDVSGKLAFKEGILVQAMRNGYWIILDELNLASTEILEALNRVLDDNREIFIPETQTVVKAHPNFMLFATQNPPGLYGGRKTLSRAFKNRFIELHFSDIPRTELEIILEKKCLIPASYARKMVACMVDLQKNRKSTSKNNFTLRDLFRWGVRYTLADKKLLEDPKYDWNQHLVEEGYLVLSAKVRTEIELEVIDETLYKNFKKHVNLDRLFDTSGNGETSLVTKYIIDEIHNFKSRTDIVWTRNMTRMAVLTAKALQFDEPVLLVGPTGCGKTTVCQLLSTIRGVNLRILNCHMHTEGADFLGGLRPCRNNDSQQETKKIFEWADGPLIQSMEEGSYFMADEISLAEDSVLERLNCILEPERTVLLAEKCGIISENQLTEGIAKEFVVQAKPGFQFLATMNPGGDFGKKELSPALRNRFTEIWCQPSSSRDDLVEIASNCIIDQMKYTSIDRAEILKIATFIVDIVLYMKNTIDKFKFSIRDILAMANFIVTNTTLKFPEKAIFGLETTFLDALEMSLHESSEQLEKLKTQIIEYAIRRADEIIGEKFTLSELLKNKGTAVEYTSNNTFGIKPFYINTNSETNEAMLNTSKYFLFEAPTTKQNLFRLLSALSLNKPILLEGPPGVGKTSIVESLAHAIGYNIVRINLCEHTDLADLFGTDLPAEDNISNLKSEEDNKNNSLQIGSFQWRDGPLLAALKANNTWILLDELNLAPQSVLEGLNAILDHRGEVYIPELNKTFALNKQTRVFASQNPLKQGGGRKGLPQSFLNRFTKVYVQKLTTEDLLFVVEGKYKTYFDELRDSFVKLLPNPYERSSKNLFDIHRSIKQNQEDLSELDMITDQNECLVPEFDLSLRLVRFSEILDNGITTMEFGYKGGPFEINLRDILFWCDLLISPQTGFTVKHAQSFRRNFDNFLLTLYERMKLVYYQRMRCEQDKQFIRNTFETVFKCNSEYLNAISEDVGLYWTNERIYINDITIDRDTQPLHFQKPMECTPLILETQRETLKNLVECVHVEKPVLLCGSTDTGKTKIIDTLCFISNQMCNLDNIDDSVTGSFQQIDLNRHLEEISFQVECIYLKFIQNTILDSSSTIKKISELLDSWNTYSVLRNYKCELKNKSFVSEELVNYRRRIDKLNNLIEILRQSIYCSANEKYTEDLNNIRNKLNMLKLHVKNTESLNTGGCFEWVDSKIVKSLKDGQYILLEHVNLCSSAVLDRLNPVFEPSGALMLSEKGVTGNEKAEIVKKADNFRAFLTLDPKNGELSRAMRNRCVEIFLNNQTPNLDDKRILVYHQGVRDINAINCIINIHDNIAKLTEINNLTISHLTQTAFLCASYKRIGYQMKRAIYVSAMEVYVYSASTDLMGYGLNFYQNKLREIVIMESEKFTPNLHQDHLKDVVLKCSSLTEIPLVNLQIVPLKIVLDNMLEASQTQEALSLLFSDFATINMENFNFEDFAKYLIYMIYETSSLNDLKYRYLQLEKCLKDYPVLWELSKILYNCVVNTDNVSILPSLPWNTKLYPRIRDYKLETSEKHGFCLSSSLILNMLIAPIPQEPLTKMSSIDVLTYSQAVAKQALNDKLNNSFLQHYSDFLFHLQKVLKSSMNQAQLDMESYTELITALQWFNRILNLSRLNLYLNKELNTDLLDKLILHFKWLDKNLLRLVHKLLPNIYTISPKLYNSQRQLLDYVSSIKHPLNVRRKMYAKHLLEFQPFSQKEEVQIFKKIQELDQLLSVIPLYGQYTPEDVFKKFAVQNSISTRRAYAIISKKYTLFDFKKTQEVSLNRNYGELIPEDLKLKLQQFLSTMAENNLNNMLLSSEDLDIIESDLNEISQLLAPTPSSEAMEEEPYNIPHEIQLNTLAIREYFLIKSLIATIENTAVNNVQINCEYREEIPFLNTTTVSLLNTCKLPYFQKYRDLWLHITNYISNMQSSKEFEELLQYLDGGYKHFSALSRLVSNSVHKLQLESLNSHLECVRVHACKDNIQSQNTFDGPPFINMMTSLLFVCESGAFKTVPLRDLDLWKNSLNQLCQIVWHNSTLVTPTYNVPWNNYIRSLRNAKRLLSEVKYLEMFCRSDAEKNLTNYTESFHNLIVKLKDCTAETEENISDNTSATGNQVVLYKSSLMNTLIGSIELCLIPFTPLIDPVEKNRLKNEYMADDIYCLNNFKSAYDFTRISMKYKNLGEEIYEAIKRNLEILKEKQSKLKEKVALRPDKCLYGVLVKDITHFLTTNCNPEVLFKLVNNVESVWDVLFGNNNSGCLGETLESCDEIINKFSLWIANSQRFVHHTLKPYLLYYQDFLKPLQCSIDQLRFGFEGLKLVLVQIKNNIIDEGNGVYVNINANNKLHKVLKNIAEFPTSKMLDIFNVNSSKDILQNRCPVFSIINKMSRCESDYFHLLKAKVVELKNRVEISHFINQELFAEFDFAFNIINQVWQREEELRRQKQKEDESLYLTKTKCEDEDEEMQELKEIEEIFPTAIQEDFGEFIQEDTLEKVIKLDAKKTPKTKNNYIVVQENDYAFIAKNFIEILVKSSQTYYHPKPKRSDNNEQIEFVDYFKERFQVFLKIYNKYKSSINDWLDEECFSSFYFSMAIQKDVLDENLSTNIKQEKPYNFYKDSNIQEIVSCGDVLNDIEKRVTEQLELYPEHATLIDIKKIIDRIRILPSTAPVVRFNTGFQILRQNVALWNEVAHKNNNLKNEEQEVAQFVQKWTRLELQFWRNCLAQTYDKVESIAYKYWFFIYNLVHEFIAEREIDSSLANITDTTKRFEEHDILDSTDSSAKKFTVEAKDIINILRQFVESSCYGDFSIRMQLLLAFELYLHNCINYTAKDTNDSTNAQIWELISGIRNLQLYFDQFSKEIEEHKKSIRAPIEKKLKELVKIESYNKDLSYFSMRNNVARVHRNLNKFLKEYEQQLKEKITAVFQPKDSTAKDFNFANDKGKDLRFDSKMKYYMVDPKYFVLASKQKSNGTEEVKNTDSAQTLLSKAQRLFNTSRNVVKETVTNAHYPKLIIALDSLLSQQLERCDHLRNLTVDRTKERPKQKLEAKHILQQKRKALTDLFKALSTLGVNYKTGLMELSMSSEFEDIFLPPFCIKSMLSNFKEKRLQPKLLQLNENLDVYFNKCVFKLKLLRNIMLTPLSELGPPNIERIKGYAVDMFLLVQNQRKLLASTTKVMYDNRVMLQQLKDLEDINSKAELDESYMNFSRFRDRCDALKAVVTRMRYVFEQLKLYFMRIPTNVRKENMLFTDADGGNVFKNSVDTSALISDCEKVLSLSKSTLERLNSDSSEFVLKDRLIDYKNTYNKLYNSVQDILKNFKTNENEYLPIAKPLIDLSTSVNDIIQEAFTDSSNSNSQCSLESIDQELESIIHSMLLPLQKLYKKYPSKTQSDEEDKQQTKKKNDDDNEELEDQHLKKKLYGALKEDWNVMDMEKINGQLTNILLTLKLSEPSVEKIELIKKLLSIQPLLEQFNLMAEYFLCQQLGAHKVSVKMLSIILTVFVEIGTKGFCVPQDLMQDEEGESKKDQKEGEGFGLEDGTGEKDASDKIESEDQLDDAKRPEDRKDENDKNEQNDCKEEKGIEMSDNFDGEMQDIEKQNEEEDDSGESENEEDMSKEMGETEEGADKLDDQIWGDDEEPEEQEEEKEMQEEDGKGNGDEQDAHNDLNSKNDTSKEDDGKNDPEKDGLDATNEPNEEDKRKREEKDIDNMKDQEEGDQDQVNPYHNELEEPEQPEDFDLGDLNVNDDNEEDEKQQGEDNPFDIDTMKDNMQDVEETQDNQNDDDGAGDKDEDKENMSDDSDSNDEDDDTSKLQNDTETPDEEKPNEEEENQDNSNEEVDEQKRGQIEEETSAEEEKENRNEKHEEYEQSKDQPMKEDNMQSVPEIEPKGSKDQLEAEKTDTDVQQDQNLDEQDTGEDKEGIGQAENETNDGGHQGIAETKETTAPEDNKSDVNTKEKRKQGRTDEDRSMGQAEQNKIKRLKTVDKINEEDNAQKEDDQDEANNDMEAEEYQHVKEPKTSDKLTLDNATEEQSKKIQPQSEEEKINENEETNENQSELIEETEEELNNVDLQEMLSEKMEKKSDNPSKSEPRNDNATTQEQLEVEGEVIETMTVQRSDDTTAHCNKEILSDKSGHVEELSAAKTLELRRIYQDQVTSQQPIIAQNEDHETWHAISNRMSQNARDLCEQLRLILEPTKCTRLKGDYRTGRRINMKKIIPYIASQFRKDKIWLRRTKPAQRDYKITIAIDDSKSMHHNNSKVLTLEAISLVSQALTLLESGRLSVISFGEQPQILLNHNEQFDGPKLVSSLQFSQDKTKIAELLDFTRTAGLEEGSSASDNGIFENLLLILSDGRNIFSEGKSKVRNAIKLARLQRIFLVYIIIDNPENKNSILDIQTMEMLPNNSINIKSYLEDFPFPYYVIVRDLNQLPTVLSEAMRQWFELVNSEQ
ncbi:midasin [Lucilia sericata]|uniref:midasin n=1 Tax=Lucilia sericata TaxID=13632 RepID=UPI0018A8044A|nr:midasin [Lucilia sericata]